MLETLKEMLEHEPFRPFRIILTSGNHYDVTSAHAVAIGESQIFYCFPRSDRFAHLRINQIAALEAIQQAA